MCERNPVRFPPFHVSMSTDTANILSLFKQPFLERLCYPRLSGILGVFLKKSFCPLFCSAL